MGSQYPHLSLEERRKIAKWSDAKMSVPEIADRLGRAPSRSDFHVQRPCTPKAKRKVFNASL
jgi:IS30 family transposase